MTEIRIGLLGAGRVARDHVAAIARVPGCRFVAVFDPDQDRASAMAEQNPALQVCRRADELLAADVDAVVVTAPTHQHFALGRDALNAGKHVLMEKPFTRTSVQAAELADLARRRGVVLMPAQVARFLPAVAAVRDRLTSEPAGRMIQAVERRFTFRTEVFPWWRAVPEFLISHWGSHSLDIFLWLTGDEPNDVSCRASSRQAGYDGIDDFTLVVTTTSGAVLSLHQTCSSRVELLDWVMVLEKATVVIDDLALSRWNGELLVEHDGGDAMAIAFTAQLAEFVAACAGDRNPETTVASIMPSMRALDQAIANAGIRAR